VVRAAAIFNIAHHVGTGSATAEEIAEAESTDVNATRRLLRTCASLGLLNSEDGAQYTATTLLATLHKDTPNSLHHFAVSQAAPGHWLPWGLFPDAIRTGRHQTTAAHGADIFDYLADHADEAQAFTASMTNLSTMVADDVAGLLDTSGVGLVVDVGGASGELVQAIMLANPELKGAVFDRPNIVADAVTNAEAKGLQDRFTVVGGDFFAEVPPADLHLLKYIIHDWDDEECVQILRNCRAALNAGGRVAIVDHLIGKTDEPGLAPLMDMNMLTMTSGRERNLAEFDALFTAAGLRRVKVTPAGNMAIIEAVPLDS